MTEETLPAITPRAKGQRPTSNGQGLAHFPTRRAERGYVLLMMMLFVALLAIGAAALAPSVTLQIRRDREEEMIHRGVQYSRAIHHYVKKFGRYPTRIEELENTNNLRFLRKRYKDPITGEDFKLLHLGEVQLAGGAGGIAGAATLAAAATAMGGAPGTGAMLGGAVAQAARTAMAANTATYVPTTNDSGQDAGAANTSNAGSPDSSKTDPAQSGSNPPELSSRIFGGGPIVGVTSTSKAQTIREFNHKNHYNQWQFIYDPSTDKGGLITTPAQPPLQVSQPLNQQQQNPSGGPNSPGTFQNPPPAQPTQSQQQ